MSNTYATLLGTPAEVRLRLYDHLFADSEVRLHLRKRNAGSRSNSRNDNDKATNAEYNNLDVGAQPQAHDTDSAHLMIKYATHTFDLSDYHDPVIRTCKLLYHETSELLRHHTTLEICANGNEYDWDYYYWPESKLLRTIESTFPDGFLARIRCIRVGHYQVTLLQAMLEELTSLEDIEIDGVTVRADEDNRSWAVDKTTTKERLVKYWKEYLSSDFAEDIPPVKRKLAGMDRNIDVRCIVCFDTEPESLRPPHLMLVSKP